MEVAVPLANWEGDEFDLGVLEESDIENDKKEANEVCDELSKLFDECIPDSDPEDNGTEPPAPPPPPPCTTEETAPHRTGILERLLQKDGQLTGAIAGIVKDAKGAISRSTPHPEPARATAPSLADVMRKRRRTSVNSSLELSDSERRKRAKNAFAVLSRNDTERNAGLQRYSYTDARFSGMRLTDAVHPQDGLAALFEHVTVVPISDVVERASEMRNRALRDAVVFGCLVRKPSKRTAKDGSRYAVWILANMPLQRGRDSVPLTEINCLVFDAAYDAHHTVPEGAVVAIRAPAVLPPKPQDKGDKDKPLTARSGRSQWAGACMRVRAADAVITLATAADYGTCDESRSRGSDVRCGSWFHRSISSACHYHTMQKLRRTTKSSRAVINNFVRPGPSRDIFASAKAPVNVSTDPALLAAQFSQPLSRTPIDNVQRHRIRKEVETRKRLVAIRAQKRALNTGAISRNAAEVALRQRQRPSVLSHRAQLATAVSSTTIVDAFSSNQRKLDAALNTLFKFGFTMRDDAGLDPPDPRRVQKLGVRLRKPCLTLSRGEQNVSKCVVARGSQNTPKERKNATQQNGMPFVVKTASVKETIEKSSSKTLAGQTSAVDKNVAKGGQPSTTKTSSINETFVNSSSVCLPNGSSNSKHNADIELSDSSDDE